MISPIMMSQPTLLFIGYVSQTGILKYTNKNHKNRLLFVFYQIYIVDNECTPLLRLDVTSYYYDDVRGTTNRKKIILKIILKVK